MYTAVRFPVLQLNAVKKQFAVLGIVPQADDHDLGNRTLMVIVWDARADTQITGSFSSPCRALARREPIITSARCALPLTKRLFNSLSAVNHMNPG